MSMGDGKAINVIEYLDNLIEKGKASKGAIVPLKVSFAKVVKTIDGDTWQDTEVKSIDVEDYMARFANLTIGKYAPESLTVYKSRVNKAISWYLQFLDKPGWTPDVQKRNRAPKLEGKSLKSNAPRTNISVTSSQTPSDDSQQTLPQVTDASNRILYPYPLSDGQLVHISLPLKLSQKDAKRIGVFIESIAIEEQLTLGAGNE